MLDLGYLRDNLQLVEQKLRDRGMDADTFVIDFKSLDQDRKAYISNLEAARNQKNADSERIGILKRDQRARTLTTSEESELELLLRRSANATPTIAEFQQKVDEVE